MATTARTSARIRTVREQDLLAGHPAAGPDGARG